MRDLLHIDDLAGLLADQVTHTERYSGKLFNAGGGLSGSLSLRELTALCQQITGNTIPIGECAEARPADVPVYITDHRRLTEFSRWQPTRNPEAILTDTYQWIRENEKVLKHL